MKHLTSLILRGTRFLSCALALLTFLAFLGLFSQRAYGLVGAHLSYGFAQKTKFEVDQEEWKHLEGQNILASFGKLSIYANPPLPIPFVEIFVGVGAGFEYFDLSNTSFDLQLEGEEITGQLHGINSPFLGPELTVQFSIPVVPVSPRGRVFYAFALPTLKGDYTHEGDTKPVKIPLTSRGLRYAAGLAFSPIPFLSFYVEHEWSQNKVGLSSTLDVAKNVAAKADENLRKLTDELTVGEFSGTFYRRGFIVGVQAGI